MMNANEAYEKAETYAKKALELDASLSEAHLSLIISQLNKYNFAHREEGLKKAISLNPNLADAHSLLATHYALMNRWDECVVEVEKALQFDPLSVFTLQNAGTWLLYAGQLERAVKYLEEASSLTRATRLLLITWGLRIFRLG